MARLPNLLRKEVSTPNVVGAVVQPQEVTAIGEAQVFAGTEKKKQAAIIQREADVLSNRVDKAELATAQSKMYEESIRISSEVEEIQDYKTWQSEYNKRMKESANQISKNISSSDQRMQFQASTSAHAARSSELVRRAAKIKGHQVRAGTLLENLDRNSKSILKLPEDQHGDIINSSHGDIDSAVRLGDITAREALILKEKFVQDYSTGMLMTRTTEQAIKDILAARVEDKATGKISYKVTETYIDFIPDDKKETHLRTFQRRMLTAQNQARTAARQSKEEREKRLEEASDKLQILFLNHSNPKHRERLLDAISKIGAVSPERYQRLLEYQSKAGDGSLRDDEPLINELRRGIMGGTDTMEDVIRNSPHMTEPTQKELQSLVMVTRDKRATRAVQMIKASFGILEETVFNARAAAPINRAAGDALVKLYQQMLSNPEADPYKLAQGLIKGGEKKIKELQFEAIKNTLARMAATPKYNWLDPDDPEDSLKAAIKKGLVEKDDPAVLSVTAMIKKLKRLRSNG